MPPSESEGSPEGAITRCLKEWRGGDQEALSRLTAAVYSELRRIAGGIMKAESANGTIQPTALVHELYLHLPGVREFDWQSRAHFLRVAAKMMRNILVDHARMRQSAKRGGGAAPVSFEPGGYDRALRIDVLLVNKALDLLAEQYPRHAQVVELRFFGGLTAEETVDVLRVDGTESSLRTVERDWKFAKAWLQDALGPL